MFILKSLLVYLAMGAVGAGIYWACAPEPDDPIHTATLIWDPRLEATREDWAPGSEPGDYSALDELMRSRSTCQP
jgi:hypothetical protein